MNESDRLPDATPHDAAWQQVARLLAGETTPEEAAGLRREMAGHPGRAELVSALDAALQPLRPDAHPDVDVEAALASVMARRDQPVLTVERGGAADVPAARPMRMAPRQTSWWNAGVLRAAAAVLLLVAGALVWRALSSRGTAVAARYATPVGARQELRLADGSQVVLGPGSRMAVSGDDGRRVQLDGEAYFQVRHDDARPFTVTTGDAQITDVGTAFTVRADSAAGTTVAVTEGVVAVALPESTQQETLRAGDRGRIMNRRVTIQRRAATQADVAWTTGRLSFRDAPVPEVVAAMRRWYGVSLRVDPSLSTRHLTADFTGQTADQAMQIVAAALGGELRRGGNGGTVVPRGSGGRAP
ncbi:MAG TPA: FecR domain-containing protein [Longimicrobium sp.]|nr:FecR domain-containing protein [Longimicrobium sp.]